MYETVFRFVLCAATMACLELGIAAGQEPAGEDGEPPVAARVNGDPIYVAELESNFSSIVRRQRIDQARVEQTKAELLAQLINRRLISQALARQGTFAEPGEVEARVKQAAEQIRKKHKVSLEEYSKMRGLTVDSLRKELFWAIAWNRYLDRHLADALEGYFDAHRKDLDGTEVRASHILLRPEKYDETPAQTEARAERLRQAIESGKISFEEAAQKYSSGPSRAKGGDLGFIPRKGAMLDEFAEVAFALEVGEISEPVTTAFGTHLIRVTEVKPGSRQWTQVIPQIKALAAADLFAQLAAEEAKSAKVQFTGHTPYLDPQTGELVTPGGGQETATQ